MGIAVGVLPLPGLRAKPALNGNGLTAPPPVTFVQLATIGTAGSGTTRSVTLPGASHTGNVLLVGLHFYGTNPGDVMSVVSVSDGTNTFTLIPGSQATNTGQ